jgi:predicted transcriptional regulator
MVGFANVENMIRKAKEYIWILSNQVLVSTLSHLEEALKRGVEFKLILPTTVIPPKDALERMYDPIFLQALQTRRFENRYLEKTDVLICLSEKEIAALGFSTIEGKLDYKGFHATDESSFKWTKTLFSHYWNIATRREPE